MVSIEYFSSGAAEAPGEVLPDPAPALPSSLISPQCQCMACLVKLGAAHSKAEATEADPDFQMGV